MYMIGHKVWVNGNITHTFDPRVKNKHTLFVSVSCYIFKTLHLYLANILTSKVAIATAENLAIKLKKQTALRL